MNGEIECLRAVAILLVLCDHLPALFHWGPMVPPFYGADQDVIRILSRFTGWTGVDLFFCISGYVISLSFVALFDRNKAEGRAWAAIKAFWVRRFFRIIPSAWLWLSVMIICSLLFNRSGTFFSLEQNLRGAIAIVFYVANFASLHQGLVPNGIYWSLALEEQFYFVFPFFLFFVGVPHRWKILLVLIALQFIPDRSNLDSLLWLTRLDAIMWGCLVFQFSQSSWYRWCEPTILKRPLVALTLSLLLIAMLGLLPLVARIHHRTISFVAILSAMLVFLASFESGYVLPLTKRAKKVFVWIGSRSYGLYLIHIPAFYMTYELWFRLAGRDLNPEYRLRLLLTAIPLLCILTEMNFRLVEVPLRRRGAMLSKRIVAKTAEALRPVATGSLIDLWIRTFRYCCWGGAVVSRMFIAAFIQRFPKS